MASNASAPASLLLRNQQLRQYLPAHLRAQLSPEPSLRGTALLATPATSPAVLTNHSTPTSYYSSDSTASSSSWWQRTLNYDFIQQCESEATLRKILAYLQQHDDNLYPALVHAAQNQLDFVTNSSRRRRSSAGDRLSLSLSMSTLGLESPAPVRRRPMATVPEQQQDPVSQSSLASNSNWINPSPTSVMTDQYSYNTENKSNRQGKDNYQETNGPFASEPAFCFQKEESELLRLNVANLANQLEQANEQLEQWQEWQRDTEEQIAQLHDARELDATQLEQERHRLQQIQQDRTALSSQVERLHSQILGYEEAKARDGNLRREYDQMERGLQVAHGQLNEVKKERDAILERMQTTMGEQGVVDNKEGRQRIVATFLNSLVVTRSAVDATARALAESEMKHQREASQYHETEAAYKLELQQAANKISELEYEIEEYERQIHALKSELDESRAAHRKDMLEWRHRETQYRSLHRKLLSKDTSNLVPIGVFRKLKEEADSRLQEVRRLQQRVLLLETMAPSMPRVTKKSSSTNHKSESRKAGSLPSQADMRTVDGGRKKGRRNHQAASKRATASKRVDKDNRARESHIPSSTNVKSPTQESFKPGKTSTNMVPAEQGTVNAHNSNNESQPAVPSKPTCDLCKVPAPFQPRKQLKLERIPIEVITVSSQDQTRLQRQSGSVVASDGPPPPPYSAFRKPAGSSSKRKVQFVAPPSGKQVRFDMVRKRGGLKALRDGLKRNRSPGGPRTVLAEIN